MAPYTKNTDDDAAEGAEDGNDACEETALFYVGNS